MLFVIHVLPQIPKNLLEKERKKGYIVGFTLPLALSSSRSSHIYYFHRPTLYSSDNQAWMPSVKQSFLQGAGYTDREKLSQSLRFYIQVLLIPFQNNK